MLGLGKYKVSSKTVCFLPFIGEFGWMIMCCAKRVHGFDHTNKVVCIKRGHECLFPTASHFFYDWQDTLPDAKKAGVAVEDNEDIRRAISERFEDVTFLSPTDTSWEEKQSLAHIHFVPEPIERKGLKTDVVLAPRNRALDPTRNWPPARWQIVVDGLKERGYTIGVIGAKSTSLVLRGVDVNAWDHTDVDSDVEMLRNARLVVGQESGMAYLAMLCEAPLLIIDHCHEHIANRHRRPGVFFKVNRACFGDPLLTVNEAHAALEAQR